MGFLFHPQLHQSQAALLSEPDQEFQVSAERRKQRYLKVELAKTSTTFRHYIIINDVAWIWKLELTERIQIPRFAGKTRTCAVGWYQALQLHKYKRDGKYYSLDWTWILDWTGLWTGLDSGLDSDYGSILHYRAFRLTSRCLSYSPSLMQKLGSQYNYMLQWCHREGHLHVPRNCLKKSVSG